VREAWAACPENDSLDRLDRLKLEGRRKLTALRSSDTGHSPNERVTEIIVSRSRGAVQKVRDARFCLRVTGRGGAISLGTLAKHCSHGGPSLRERDQIESVEEGGAPAPDVTPLIAATATSTPIFCAISRAQEPADFNAASAPFLSPFLAAASALAT
jgi:hypothetical protein